MSMSTSLSAGMRWYAVQCLSNHEDKVRRYLAKYKEEDEVFAKDLNEVLVPIETVSEVKNGKRGNGIVNFILVMSSWK